MAILLGITIATAFLLLGAAAFNYLLKGES